jgi:hypothetical protein
MLSLTLDGEDRELKDDGLPEGTSLSSSKALKEEYPDDEKSSKKTKKSKTCKSTEGNHKSKN